MTKRNQFLQDEEFIKWRLYRTSELNLKWKEFRRDNPALQEELDEAISIFKSIRFKGYPLSNPEKVEMWENIRREVLAQKRIRRIRLFVTSAAALLAVAIVSSLLYFSAINSRVIDQNNDKIIIGESLPGEEIYLITGEGRMELSNNSSVEITSDSRLLIKGSVDSKKEISTDAKLPMNKLVVPFGRRSSIILADGSKLIVNSGTVVEFPTAFSGKTRDIRVQGEIFVDVKSDAGKPFIVHTQKMDIKVFGTTFNVEAYNDDQPDNVVLVTGKVQIVAEGSEVDLLPSQKAEFADGNINIEDVEVSPYISWTRDVLEFNETSLAEILKKIGRYYNVSFENSHEFNPDKRTFSGKLYLSPNLDSVMISISTLTSTKYSREDNTIIIRK